MPPYECLCPPGGVIAMRPLLVHASSKSVTTASRRVLHIEYLDRGSWSTALNSTSPSNEFQRTRPGFARSLAAELSVRQTVEGA